ncbi:MAG: prepilin-type N-terminal cleavage/methylation domain-containing protein [Bacilli bacterium]|nr:prepilin-type N-terminal cleavage/methylation domain-containing protein [Bacilli bacterium]
MKKGFTLVELIAVLAILSILALIAIPSIDKVLKNTRNELYETQLTNIENCAKNWGADNLLLLPTTEGETVTLTLGQLKAGGYVESDIKNPKNNELFPDTLEVVITRQASYYTYEVDEDTIS